MTSIRCLLTAHQENRRLKTVITMLATIDPNLIDSNLNFVTKPVDFATKPLVGYMQHRVEQRVLQHAHAYPAPQSAANMSRYAGIDDSRGLWDATGITIKRCRTPQP